ncbi:MAG: MATE family efflux transporter [Agathobacter sp.]|nr:MATE family efflux transporter [Agathobacter sp.]
MSNSSKQQMSHYDKMTQTPLVKLIVSLGIPTTISMLVTSIYNMADTYFVGTLGESQQGATGILFTLQAIIQAIAFMLGQGSGTMVSKAQADRNGEEANEYVSTGFYVSLAFGMVLMIGGLMFLKPFMMLLGSTETILPYAMQYGACVLISCPMVMGSFVLNNNLRYEGKAFFSMIGLVSGSLINILGDYLLVIVFPLGVLGAGISTAVSQTISFGILLYFYRKRALSKILFKSISRKVKVYTTICRVGFPALIRQGLTSISNGLLNNLTRPYGDAAIAAMSVVNRFSAFVMCVGLGIGQGYQPVASFNYQAKKLDRVKKGLLVTMTISVALVAMLAIPGFIFAEQIVWMFQKSEAVAEIGVFALRCACVGTLFLPLSVPVNMLYQSTRQVMASTLLSLLRSGLMFIPTLIITTSLWGITGIQISQPLADILTGFATIPFIAAFMRRKE